ncbi:MAG: hypothetical protein KJ597_02675 [Nanoarchaeota archaeon]|nr:hypothetical protein [Nanoarchaeota archaeon]MBU1622455.1 hypothetical protein [Nanoarchaeota archaeon]
MSERYIVTDHLKFSYEGLFNYAELYNLITSFFFEKGWDWYEKMNEELVTAEGRQYKLILEPWKTSSDYYKIVIRTKLHGIDIKDVEVEHEKKTLRLNQGLIRITFDAYVITDRHSKWEDKPLFWFLNTIGELYFNRRHFKKFETWVKSDLDDLYQKIKNYLNVYKYTYQT